MPADSGLLDLIRVRTSRLPYPHAKQSGSSENRHGGSILGRQQRPVSRVLQALSHQAEEPLGQPLPHSLNLQSTPRLAPLD